MLIFPASAVAQEKPISLIEEKTFDFKIKAGDLSKELAQFSEFTGQQLFYDSTLAHGRQGRAVLGNLTSTEGLLTLLQGTGLSAHINGGDITLSQSVYAENSDKSDFPSAGKAVNLDVLVIESSSIIFGGGPNYQAYAGYVASQVKTAVLMNKHLDGVQYDILAKIWLDSNGHIVRLQLPPDSEDDDVNKEIALTLDHLAVNPPPPANMPAFRIRIQSVEP